MKTTSGHTTYLTAYKFNGKEMDAETGLYYYGARYYEPELAMWYGVDALAEKYVNITPYHYCFDNPIRFIDPDGNDGKATVDYENNTIVIEQNFYYNENNKAFDYYLEPENIKQFGFDQNGQPWNVEIEGQKWKVQFETNFIGKENDDAVEKAFHEDTYGNKITYEPIVESKKTGEQLNAVTLDKRHVILTPNVLFTNTEDVGSFVHEQGHTLGLPDTNTFGTGEAMSYIERSENATANRKIQNKEIISIVSPLIKTGQKTVGIHK